jgi:nucleoside-diphosphate-sugar epimerase
MYRAAQAAGVRRLIHLSTASVHGQAPAPGTDEATPLSTNQRIPYNNAKVRAEQELLRARAGGTVEVVLLRPGIVHGPRSQWTGGLADDLLAGRASLVEGGHGICNAAYVDNVVHATRLAFDAPDVDGEAFLIGDRERVSWLDLYRPVATALGIDVDALPRPAATDVGRTSVTRRLRGSTAWRHLPVPLQAGLRAAYRATRDPASPHPIDEPPPPSLEQVLLQTCAWALPWDRARHRLGYEPPVTFAEASRRSVAWLAFAGYPVVAPEPG